MAFPFCVVSVDQCASILAISKRTVYEMLRTGKLQAYRQQRTGARKAWRIPMWSIRDWQMQMISKAFARKGDVGKT